MSYREKYLDPDNRTDRRDVRIERCERCGKTLKPELGPYRRVLVADPSASMSVVHPDDWSAALSSGGEFVEGPIGHDCAEWLGLEWSRPQTA